MYEFFSGLLCLVNFFLIGAAAAMLYWTRHHVKGMRTRLATVEAQLAVLQKAKPGNGEQAVAIEASSPVQLAPVQPHQPASFTPEAASPPPPVVIKGQWPDESLVSTGQPAVARWTENPLIAWFVQMHLMVQAGILVLFFGVGFLIKYVVEQGWFPLELRLISAALLGAGLAAVGWRVRERRRVYGLALLGGGIGIIYLTTFGAYFFYGLIPALAAFTIFVCLSIIYALMALANDTAILAFLAIVGAFLAPLLASNGGGNHILLFSYYAVVNAGVLAIAWRKHWPSLNLVSFLFSLAAGAGWAYTTYQPAYFASTELFLALFFGFYLTISLWQALRHDSAVAGVDTILLFANPLATFVLQSFLVADRSDWLAYSAFAVAAIYAVMGLICHQRQATNFFTQVFFFLASFFLALAIPLRFDPRLTSAIWAIQGVGQLWLGVQHRRTWPQRWGVLVQLLAGGAFLVELLEAHLVNLAPFANYLYMSALILSGAAILSATIVRRSVPAIHGKMPILAYGLLWLGLGWWYAGGVGQFALYAERTDRLAILLLFITISGLLGELYGTLIQWRAPRYTLLSILPAAALIALYWFVWQSHPFSYGWYVWPVILAMHLLLLWRWRSYRLQLYHAGGVWLSTFLLTWWVVQQGNAYEWVGAWSSLALLTVPTVALLLLSALHEQKGNRGDGHRFAYGLLAASPLAIFLIMATLWVNQTNVGSSAPLPFVPFLNPLDLMLAAVLGVIWQWSRRLQSLLSEQQFSVVDKVSQWGIWILSFWVFNMAIARAVHHLGAVPFTFTALYNSAIVQTTYALVWGLLALTLMYLAHHRAWHHVWYIGATLLGITIIKLFLVDLAHTGSLARIVSFISVGLLTITVAYFWPAPPRVSHRLQPDRS